MAEEKLSKLIKIKKGDYITKSNTTEGIYPVILGGQEPAYFIDKFNHTGKAITMSRSGASAGYVSFWNEPIFLTDGYLIEPKEMLTYEYLYYSLKSRQSQIHLLQTGSAIPHITPKLFNSIKIDVPNKTIQNKIVKILQNYDDLIELNNQRIKLLEQTAEEIYKEWFVRFRFPEYEKTEFENGIPKEWAGKRLNTILTLQSGYSFKSQDYTDNGKYKVITIKNVQNNGFEGNDTDKIDFIPSKMPKYCILNEGDLLLSLTGNVGRICIVHGKGYLLNQRVAKIKTKYPYYVYCLFKNYSMFLSLINLSNGTAQQNLSPIKTENMRTIIPDNKSLQRFDNIVRPLFSEMLILKNSNDILTKQRDFLLPRLMSGKLEI